MSPELALDASKMEAQQKKIAVLILNWNGMELLKSFLPSVIEFNHEDAEIIVVDNHSSDESVIYLKDSFPFIKRIEFKTNHGFAKGYNLAIEKLNHEFIVLLNTDVRVTKNWIDAPLKFLQSNHKYAACQPKILDENKHNLFEYAGASGGFIDVFGYPFCRGRLFNYLEQDNGQYDTTIDVMWASGAALFVSNNKYKEAGGLDPDFFAHQEEIDLCWRWHNMGYKIACVPSSCVFHIGGASLSKQDASKTFLNFRNNLVMLLKNLPTQSFSVIFFRLILDGLAGLKYIFEGKPSHCFAIIKAHISFYVRIPRILINRKKVKHLSTDIKYSGSIVVDFYLRGIKVFRKLSR